MLYTSTITRPSRQSEARSGRREFIILYALAATLLTTALTLSWGRITNVGWVNSSLGGLLLGATQGLLQYAILRSRHRISPLWVAAPAVAWAIAMGIDWPLDGQGPGAGILEGIVSPIGIALSGLGQWLLLPKTRRHRWLKVVLAQLLWVGLVQVLTFGVLFVTAVVAIATLGKATALLSVLHLGASGLYHSQLLAHSLIPASGLSKLWRAD